MRSNRNRGVSHRRAVERRRRPLLEPVEPRLLLCALHYNDGNSISIKFGDNDGAGATPAAFVGPTTNLQSQPVALFNPITSWPTAANGLPLMNSLPGAPAAIYLDFDGDTGTNTTAYSEDADSTTYNATEQANIVEAWRQISAYFAMFDVNVTTQTTSLPKAWEIIGNNAGGATGGYAFVGTFPAGSGPTAFNTSSNARTRQSGMAHELGHVFGLQHQSSYDTLANKTAEYLSAPDSLHGPIMGVDYSGSVHKWFIGHPSTSPGTLQDDLTVIANKIKAREPAGGDGYRADDFANTIATAAPLTDDGVGLHYASGIVERMSDVDMFSFVAGGGAMVVSVTPDAPSGLDARLEIYDADGHRVAAKDGATNDQQLTLTLPAGTYYVSVSSHGDYGDLGMYDLSVRSLPDGWAATDIGTTGVVGYTSYAPSTGTFVNAGGGTDLAGTTDHFHFGYIPLNGDGEIVARLNQVDAGTLSAGLEIRNSFANNAIHAAVLLNPAGASSFVYRTSTGGTAASNAGAAGLTLPRWLRLVRSGNLVSGYTSPDGVSWDMVSKVAVSLGSTAYVGLLTCAGANDRTKVATFDSVAITGDTSVAPPTYNALPAPLNVVVAPAPAGTGLTLTWDPVDGATAGYAIQRSSDGVTFAQVGTTAAAADATTYADANPGATMRYFYRVTARDATGASVPSDAASAVNRPTAPINVSITAWNTGSLVVNWKDVSGDTGYRVERSSDGGATWSPLATVGTNVPSYTNSGLGTATTFQYRVITLSPAGESAPSTTATGATRLAAVPGIAIDSTAINSISFHWTDIALETGYRIERSNNGTTWTTLANVVANQTTYTDTTVSPLTEYYYRVFGTAGIALSLNPTGYAFTATPAATALPAPWTSVNVGAVAGTGAIGYSGTTFTIISGGTDIGGTVDNFRFTSQPLAGDGQIVARISSVENTDASAKSGVMFRASTASNAPYAAVFVTPGAGVTMQTRATFSGTTTTTTGLASATAPYWVKLVRAGNAFTGYYSPDGNTWTQITQTTLAAVPTAALVGLATSSHTTDTLSLSSIASVTVSNSAPTVVTPASANPNPIVADNNASLSVLAADDHGESALKYTWAVTARPDGATAPAFTVNGTNASKNTIAKFPTFPGDYTLTVTITDAGGLSTTSSVTVTVSNKAPTVAAPASADPNPIVTGNTTALSVRGADDAGEATLTYTWSVTARPDGAADPTFSTNGTNAAKNTTATLYAPGDYTFTVTITDAGGRSTTSSVNATVSTVFPAATATAFDYHRAISVTFNTDVSASLTPDDLTVQSLAGDPPPPLTPTAVSWNADTRTATFTFDADFATGDYRATLAASGVSDGGNLQLAAGTSLDFFVLPGDVNRDRSIDFNDLVLLAQNYNTPEGMSYLQGDLTGDGAVDFNDLVLLAQNYNQSLTPPTPPTPPPTPATPQPAASAAATPGAPKQTETLFSTSRIAPPKPKPITRPVRRSH